MDIVDVVDNTPLEKEKHEHKRGHLLLPDDIRASIPTLYKQAKLGDEAIAYVRFTSHHGWSWFVTEFDGQDKMYGLVRGHELEWGFFSLSELTNVWEERWGGQPAVQRVLNFTPMTITQAREVLVQERPWMYR